MCLIGYGKMGEAIEKELLERSHQICGRITGSNRESLPDYLKEADLAIEFTSPDAAIANIIQCFKQGVPVICGTTGWNKNWDEVEKQAKELNGSLIYASNFSVGVQIFFALNRKLASMMSNQNEFTCSLKEIHHTHKKDAPSGTALSLALDIIENHTAYDQWSLADPLIEKTLHINSERKDPVVGTHIVSYTSNIDQIEIKHEAFSRRGFALGAVIAAEWLYGKQGIFTMKDVLNLED